MMDAERIAQAVEPLISWYRLNERPLPWREKPVDPYRVWISEIMLQQTRIEAVIPYFLRFMSELPTVKDLASVSDERLLKLWEGLGYYSRARNLKKAALLLCEKFGGTLPKDVKALESLPGIGSYTAGAIASIAFGEASPAVDGNVLRVLSRLCAWEDDIAKEKTKMKAIAFLQEVYPLGEDAGCLTQGLMELGEVCCIPNGAPHCLACPVADLCLAKEREMTDLLPVKSAKKQRRIEKRTVLILESDGRYAIRKRADSGLLASMPEFPSLSEGEDVEAYLQSIGLRPLRLTPCGETVHVFSHVEWHMSGLWVQCEGISEAFQWYTPEEVVHSIPLPTAFRFYRKLLQGRNQ